MIPIQLAIDGAVAAFNLAKAIITALSADEAAAQAHLADLNARLDVTQGRVESEAAATRKALENLPPK